MEQAVLPIARRILEPFDIDVVLAATTDLSSVAATLAQNDPPSDDPADSGGHNDAYVFIVESDPTLGGGLAAVDDLNAQMGNRQDEAAIVFADVEADTVAREVSFAPGSAEFNQLLARHFANIAVHEAFHTFSGNHTAGAGFPQLDSLPEFRLAVADVIKVGADITGLLVPKVVTRFPLEIQSFVSGFVDNHLLLASDPDIGLRDDDNDGVPNYAYVTGTGASDLIRLELDPGDSNLVHVTVTPFADAARTDQLERDGQPLSHTYDIRLDGAGANPWDNTEGTFVIEGSFGSDRIEIDSAIAADFRVRTLGGEDEVVFTGGAAATGSVLFEDINGVLTTGAAPRVETVRISGSSSTHAEFDFASVDGSAAQLQTVPVGGADTVSIVFSEPIDASDPDRVAGALSVVGLASGNTPALAPGGFAYDAATRTASWTFTGWTFGDRYAIWLDDRVVSPEGAALDGEWVNPSSESAADPGGLISEFPSGDGLPGGDFVFVATLLPGDANLDGRVDISDLGILGENFGAAGLGVFFSHADFNGDGLVDLTDLGVLGEAFNADLTGLLNLLADLDGDLDVDANDFDPASPPDLNGDTQIDALDQALADAQYGLVIRTELTTV